MSFAAVQARLIRSQNKNKAADASKPVETSYEMKGHPATENKILSCWTNKDVFEEQKNTQQRITKVPVKTQRKDTISRTSANSVLNNKQLKQQCNQATI